MSDPCPDCGLRGDKHANGCVAVEQCTCHYDLCGECMKRPGPKRHMTIPGPGRFGDPR